MKLTFLSIKNISCFKGKHTLNLSDKLNLFVGPNNSGKTTILRAIYRLQSSEPLNISIETSDPYEIDAYIKIVLNPNEGFMNIAQVVNGNKGYFLMRYKTLQNERITIEFTEGQKINVRSNFTNSTLPNIFEKTTLPYPSEEPNNIIYPFFSKRKIAANSNYNERSAIDTAIVVDGTLNNLVAKTDRIISSQKSTYSSFVSACKAILGFTVSMEPAPNGKKIVLAVNDNDYVELTSMGEGTANMLGFIVDIYNAKDKIFIIEEPENDIHPKALKELLKLIEAKSETNQFFISTHSNIVIKYLGGSVNAKIFQTSLKVNKDQNILLPSQSKIKEVGTSGEERIKLLEDLGYDLYDYEMWNGWIFFEESSAEVVVREFLIPNFTNLQGKVVTHGAKGKDELESRFESFNRLFVYLHQDQIYKNRSWVIVDDGTEEKKSLTK